MKKEVVLDKSKPYIFTKGNIKSTFDYEPYGIELQPLSEDETSFKYKFTDGSCNTFRIFLCGSKKSLLYFENYTGENGNHFGKKDSLMEYATHLVTLIMSHTG